MRASPLLFVCLLAVCAVPAAADDISCTNAADIAAVRAELDKNCEQSVLCRPRKRTVETMVEDFKAGKVSLQLCSSTLKGIYEDAKRFAPLPPSGPPPRPGGGGGGGGRIPPLI